MWVAPRLQQSHWVSNLRSRPTWCTQSQQRNPWWRHQMETFLPRYWPFARGIHWSPVNSPHKGQWRGALMFSLICVWFNGSANNRDAGGLRRYSAHCDVIVMHWTKGGITQSKRSIGWVPHYIRLSRQLVCHAIFFCCCPYHLVVVFYWPLGSKQISRSIFTHITHTKHGKKLTSAHQSNKDINITSVSVDFVWYMIFSQTC